MVTLEIIGRRSSLFTRVTLIFAEELAVPYQVTHIEDMSEMDPQVFGGNPAMKLPILRRAGATLFGAQNICRAIAERSSEQKRIVWPEALTDDVSRNAQELVWHCMAAQVQLVFGIVINHLPAENVYFAKSRASLELSLNWLDRRLSAVLEKLPARDLSLFEVSLHCLIEHLSFRPTIPVAHYRALSEFADRFALRTSAERTAYRFDRS